MKQNIYIVGAHSRGMTLGHYLKYLDSDINIVAYLFDNDEDNPQEVNGVPVIKIDDNTILDIDAPVYLGVRGINQESISNNLKRHGIKTIIHVDVEFDLEIRNKYLKKYYESIGREYIKIDDLKNNADDVKRNSYQIYVATSVYDKELTDLYESLLCEKKLQVGAELTDVRLNQAALDNTGDNISKKNKQFCELTGLYWIWKNAVEDVVGLVHYRRHFILPNDWLDRMENNNIDVILPIPLYVGPNLEANFRKRHEESVWDAVISILKQQDNNEEASSFFKETALYYPCNMFIMRKEVLDDLCKWMFPILFRLVEKCGVLDDTYQNRYPGFVSERLITYFFEKNRNKYKLVYADKNFLQ